MLLLFLETGQSPLADSNLTSRFTPRCSVHSRPLKRDSCSLLPPSPPTETHQTVGVSDEDRLHGHPSDEGSWFELQQSLLVGTGAFRKK